MMFRLPLTALIAVMCAIASHSQNKRHYFPEGIMSDTIVFTNSDNAHMSIYSAMEIRAAVPGAKEQQNPWHEGFGVQIATTDSSYTRIMLYPANSDYGFLSDQPGMLLKIWTHSSNKDSEVHSQILTENIANGRHENSLCVESFKDGMVRVFAGKNSMNQVYEFNLPNATQGERYAVFNGKISLHLLVDEYTPDISATLRSSWTIASLNEYFDSHSKSLKPLEGYWQYLDQDTDENYAHIGGRYKLAIVDNNCGGYNILYISGAITLPHLWLPGMHKGQITSTIFPDNYDLIWIDSEMQQVNREAFATLEQNGHLLVLSIPTLKSTMRFFRMPTDNTSPETH